MKRTIAMAALITTAIIGLFLANQALLLASPSVPAGERMLTAGQFYDTGQYGLAAQAYQQLVDQGFAEAALFYNLGNAYYKQGDVGRALLNYRRAERFAPRDADIAANLKLVRAQIAAQPDATTGSEGVAGRLAQLTRTWLTLDELALTVLGAWVVLAVLLIAFSNSRPGSRLRAALPYALTITALVTGLGFAGLVSRLYLERTQPEAVVVAEAAVTDGPGKQDDSTLTLHPGTEVILLETRDDWVRMALPNSDVTGWLPAAVVEAVSPS
jgi:tetratricopeptide (TPR) repeat protein